MATKGKKSHFYLNTSTLVSRLNTIIRNKIVFIELAGWIHEALVRVTKDQVKPWMFHCMSSKFAVPRPEDAPFLKESPIDPAWVRAAAKHVVEKFKQVFDVVTDGGDAAGGRCVGVFEGLFGPKEDGPARASRDAALQKMINENKFTAAASVPDCLVRETMRMFDENSWEFTYYYEGEATVVAQFDTADYCLMTSDDVDARFMLFKKVPAAKEYIIFPRKFYARKQLKNPEGLFWPEGSLLGVIVSDEDFQNGSLVYPDGKNPDGTGKGQGYDISPLSPYDRLFFLLETGSDLVHARGSGAHVVLRFMFETMEEQPIGAALSPVDWIRKYAIHRGFNKSTEDAHMEALFAYLLHPVPRIIDRTERPFRYRIENLVRYHEDETNDGWSIQKLVEDGLSTESQIRKMIVKEPYPWNPPIMAYTFRGDHSCFDKHPNKEYAALTVSTAREDLPPLSSFKSVYTLADGLNPGAPKMDINVLHDYARELESKYVTSKNARSTFGSSFSRGHERSMAVYSQMQLDPKKQENLKFFIDPSNRPIPNGPPCEMYIYLPVPRRLQQYDTRGCYIKCAYGLIYDADIGGEILKIPRNGL